MQSADMLHQGQKCHDSPTIVCPALNVPRSGDGSHFCEDPAQNSHKLCTNSLLATDLGKLRSRSQLSFSIYICVMADPGQGRIFFYSRCYWIRWKSFTFQRKIWNVNSPRQYFNLSGRRRLGDPNRTGGFIFHHEHDTDRQHNCTYFLNC